MNRTQRRRARLKRRLTFAYAVASVLTLGVSAVFVYTALQQRAWSLAWFGCWAFVIYQLVMLVVHVRGAVRTHHEYEELIAQDSGGGRYAA